MAAVPSRCARIGDRSLIGSVRWYDSSHPSLADTLKDLGDQAKDGATPTPSSGWVGWVVLSRWARVTHGDRAQTLTSAKWPNGLHRAQYTCVSLGCVRWVLPASSWNIPLAPCSSSGSTVCSSSCSSSIGQFSSEGTLAFVEASSALFRLFRLLASLNYTLQTPCRNTEPSDFS